MLCSTNEPNELLFRCGKQKPREPLLTSATLKRHNPLRPQMESINWVEETSVNITAATL